MAVGSERLQAETRLREQAFADLWRVFRLLPALFGDHADRVEIALRYHGSGEPYISLATRDGLSGKLLGELSDLLGQNLDLSLEPSGAIVIECPSWPVPF